MEILDFTLGGYLLYSKQYSLLGILFILQSLYIWIINLNEADRQELKKENGLNFLIYIFQSINNIHNKTLSNSYLLPIINKYYHLNKQIKLLFNITKQAVINRFFIMKKEDILFNNLSKIMNDSLSKLTPSEKIKLKYDDRIIKYKKNIENILNSDEYKINIKNKGYEKLDDMIKTYIKNV